MHQRPGNILRLFFIFSFLLNCIDVYAQNCNQNNVSVEKFSLLDAAGNLFTSSSNYQLGEVVSGRLYVTLALSNSGNAYSTKLFFDLIIGGVNMGRKVICLSDRAQLNFGVQIFVINVTWKWGELVEAKNLLLRWSTNISTPCSELTEAGSSAQCYGSIGGFLAELPVLPDFSYLASYCNPLVNFSDLSVGGKPPYSYVWNFAGFGFSILKNPSFSFPGVGTYSVSLTTTDSEGISNTKTKNITIPTFDIIVETSPTKYGQNTGSIKVDVSGGNAPYSISWYSDPAGQSGSVSNINSTYTIPNLGSADYYITVTDNLGCVRTIMVELDWAQLLGNPWNSFDATLDKDKRMAMINWSTKWEKNPSQFIIERSIANITDFIEIGELESPGFSEVRKEYSFVDENLPLRESRVYYRIKQVDFENMLTYTQVNSIFVPEQLGALGWRAFPNPSVHNKLQLHYLGNPRWENEGLSIKISSPHFQSTFETSTSGHLINLDDAIQSFPTGLLLVEIRNGQHAQTIKVIKQ